MVEVRLHGDLARQFGRVWHLNISTPQEAVAAIDANADGFRAKIRELARKGMQFRVRTLDHDFTNDDVHCTIGSQKRLDIIPILVGASSGVRFVVGAVLVIAAAFGYGNQYTVSLGISLMLGSVAEWLTAQPKRKDNPGGATSWSLDGPSNTVDQGLPVPIIYGEVLTGAYTISGGISVAQLNPLGTTAGIALIGGEFDQNTIAEVSGTAIFRLSVGAFNIDDPLTYTWSYTGFSSATAVRVSGTTAATMVLELDYPAMSGGQVLDITGQVTAQVVGFKPNTRESGEPDSINASSSQIIHLYLSNPQDNG